MSRIHNLRSMLAAHGYSVVSQRAGVSYSYLSQLAGPRPTRPITEKTARKLEIAMQMPVGWLDRPQRNGTGK